nr:MAG TPA: hypothetical protein [Caudoviricetes sp.]
MSRCYSDSTWVNICLLFSILVFIFYKKYHMQEKIV